MTGNIERSALLLAGGIVVGSIVVSITMAINTSKLSKSLIAAGERSRSHSSSSFPSEPRVQLSETSMDLPPEKRAQLQDAFIQVCIGQVYKNKTIKEVKSNENQIKYWGSYLSFKCEIEFEDGSIHEDFEAHLRRDGFGGYEGFLGANGDSHLMFKDIRI